MHFRLTPARQFTPSELESWKQSIFDIYDRMRKKAKGPYDVEYGGLSFRVLPNVYAPEFFDDTLWYARQIQNIVGDKSLLEIGTGTGVIAVFCARNGAKVTATDVNPDAVENARINVSRHSPNISVKQGDMYKALQGGEKFDFIFWAHPFNNWEMDTDDMLLRSGIDPKYESLRNYVSGAKDHLVPGGKLLLGTGDSADLNMIAKLAAESGYAMKLLCESGRPLERGGAEKITDLIYEFVAL